MKNKTTKAVLLTFLLISLFTFQGISQNDVVACIENSDNIQISGDKVERFLKDYEPLLDIGIIDLEVDQAGNDYYLLVKCKVNHKENWVYIIELESKKENLVIKKDQLLNACESEFMSIDQFQFIEGQVSGCVEYNHKVSKKQ